MASQCFKDSALTEPVIVYRDGYRIKELVAERVRLDTETEILRPTFRLDFNTAIEANGTIYAAAGPGFMFISADEGRTWHRRLLADMIDGDWDTSGDSGWEGPTITGFGIAGSTFLLLIDNPTTKPRTISVYRSTDSGKTWESPIEIDTSPFVRPTADASGFYQLPTGTILLPVALDYCRETEADENLPIEKIGFWAAVYRSTDEGRTWGEKSIIGDSTDETQLLLKDDGTILAVIRRQGSPLLPQGVNKTLFLADSCDQGRTWANLRQFSDEHGSCHGEALQLSDGRVVMLVHKRYPYTDGDVRAFVSRDGGTTWEPEIYIVCSRHGYPGSVVLSDDTIVTVTGDEQQDERGRAVGLGHTAQCVRWRIP